MRASPMPWLVVAGCRLNFDAVSSAGEDAGPDDAQLLVAHCGDAVVVCDDFDDDAWMPWILVDVPGGSIVVTDGCGTGGSRCARASTPAANRARLAFGADPPSRHLVFEATVTIRHLSTASAQLMAFDLTPDAAAVDQSGIAVLSSGLRLYDYSFTNDQIVTVESGPPLTIDQPVRLVLETDFVAREHRMVRSDTSGLVLPMMSALPSSRVDVQLGLFVEQPGWIVDFDDVVVRAMP